MMDQNYFKNLSNTDVQHVMRICEQLHQSDPDQSFVHHCHEILNQAFSNIHFAAELYQLNPSELKEQEIHTLDNDEWIPLFKDHIPEHPFAGKMFGLTAPEQRMTHMESTLIDFPRSTLYNEFYNPVEAQNQLWAGIPDCNQLFTCVYSRETPYTEAELAMLCIIQPHLETAWKNSRQSRSLKQELDLLKESIFQSEEKEVASVNIRRMLESLSTRQRDVVELVAQGKDNQQIADELEISILTVKKHLQMVFQALDLQHRTQLAAKWHQAFSVQLY